MDSRCPRGLKCLPNSPCAEGRKAVDAARKGKEAGCPWFVADAESNYCVWKYLSDQGLSRETPVPKITRLLMIEDESIVKNIIKEKSKVVAKVIE